jgi:copper resistance protein C
VSHSAQIRGTRLRVLALLWTIPILTLLAILGVVTPAAAHSELRSSTPASGASLDSPPRQVVLTFSDEVDPRYANLTLAVGGGRPHALRQKVEGNRVAAELDGDSAKASGRWSVGYRVVSADGHPITGVLSFTVKQPTPTPSTPISASPSPLQPSSTARAPTSSATAAVAAAGDSQAGTTGPGFSVIVMLAIGAAVAMMALGAAVWRARSKSPR